MLENDVKNLQNRLKILEQGLSQETNVRQVKSNELVKVRSSGN